MGERKSRRDRGRSILYSLSTIVLIFARSQRSDTPHPPSFLYSLLLILFQLIFSYSPPSSRSSPSPLLFSCFFSSSSCFSIIFSPFSLSPLPHLFPLILFILSPPSLTLPSSHQKTNSNGPVIGLLSGAGERDRWRTRRVVGARGGLDLGSKHRSRFLSHEQLSPHRRRPQWKHFQVV